MRVLFSFVLASGLGSGRYGFPSKQSPTASFDPVKAHDLHANFVAARTVANYPNASVILTNASSTSTTAFDAAPRVFDRPTGVISSARRLFASPDFDDATRAFDRPSGGTFSCWYFDGATRDFDRPTGGTHWWDFDGSSTRAFDRPTGALDFDGSDFDGYNTAPVSLTAPRVPSMCHVRLSTPSSIFALSDALRGPQLIATPSPDVTLAQSAPVLPPLSYLTLKMLANLHPMPNLRDNRGGGVRSNSGPTPRGPPH